MADALSSGEVTQQHERPKPFVLVILDGWGSAPPSRGNPLAVANLVRLHGLMNNFPTITLRASGEAVGLSWGEQGNSEVGHLTIGAGKVYYQSLPRINMAIQSGEFFTKPAFLDAFDRVRKNRSSLHLVGIVSGGGIHGLGQHMYALMSLAKDKKVKEVYIHVILDGRDTPLNSGIDFVQELERKCGEIGIGRIASMSGRFFAMDRDERWDRVKAAYDAMTGVSARTAEYAVAAIQESYAKETYDEEFEPTVIVQRGKPVGPIEDGDAVIFTNFRPDRARELTHAFVHERFDKFERGPRKDVMFVTMTQYEAGTGAIPAFPPEVVETCLAKVVSDAGLAQLHVAETEKYAHVTFFLNGMREEPFPGEERIIVPSPQVQTYDQAPEMSAPEITRRVVEEIGAGKFDFIAVNLANADMVGHTGKFDATKKGAEAVDAAVGALADAVLAKGGMMVITADHGNAEEVVNLESGDVDKEHSTNPVPFVIVSEKMRFHHSFHMGRVGLDPWLVPPVGTLADVAPTILESLKLPQPPEMTGVSLLTVITKTW